MDITERIEALIPNGDGYNSEHAHTLQDAIDEIESLRAKLAVAEHGLRFTQAEIAASTAYYNRALTRIKNILSHSEGVAE